MGKPKNDKVVLEGYPRLREWRKHLKLTQAVVGEAMGVSAAAVSRWENYPYDPADDNNRVIDVPTLAQYAAALGLPSAAILYSAPADILIDPLIANRSAALRRQAVAVVKTLIANDDENHSGNS